MKKLKIKYQILTAINHTINTTKRMEEIILFEEINNGKSEYLSYNYLPIHTACEERIGIDNFKKIVLDGLNHVNVILYDHGTPIQILLSTEPDEHTYDKFIYLIENGADVNCDNIYAEDLFTIIMEQPANLNYTKVLEYLIINNLYHNDSYYEFIDMENVVGRAPIRGMLNTEIYRPIVEKYATSIMEILSVKHER